MKRLLEYRYYYLLLFIIQLNGCSMVSPELTWITPGDSGSVAGTVQLRVATVGETPLVNVVFSANSVSVAKVYAEENTFSAVWNSKDVPPGSVTLTAKPYGGPAISRVVTVTNAESE